MKAGEVNTDLLKKRSYIISEIENIINDSIYYRNHSSNISERNKIIIAKFQDNECKKVIL